MSLASEYPAFTLKDCKIEILIGSRGVYTDVAESMGLDYAIFPSRNPGLVVFGVRYLNVTQLERLICHSMERIL
jgi:hypothetical protein